MVVDLSPGSGGCLPTALKVAMLTIMPLSRVRRSMQRSAIATAGQPKSIFTLEWECRSRHGFIRKRVSSFCISYDGGNAQISIQLRKSYKRSLWRRAQLVCCSWALQSERTPYSQRNANFLCDGGR